MGVGEETTLLPVCFLNDIQDLTKALHSRDFTAGTFGMVADYLGS